jgi:hypothetical protein
VEPYHGPMAQARVLFALLALAACSDEPQLPVSSASVALACACDAAEDCDGCFRRVGECCYEDATIGGQASAMAVRCADDPACQVCCSECTRLPCDELIRRQMCPPVSPP